MSLSGSYAEAPDDDAFADGLSPDAWMRTMHLFERMFAPSPLFMAVKNRFRMHRLLLKKSDDTQPHQAVRKVAQPDQGCIRDYVAALEKERSFAGHLFRRTVARMKAAVDAQGSQHEAEV